MNSDKGELAAKFFEEGYNCAQAVAMAFAEEMQMPEEKIAKTVSSFGGGMGRMREVCGAVTGMFFVLSSLHGYSDPKDYDAKKKLYEEVQTLANEFRKENGSIICKNLLVGASDTPAPEKRTNEYYKKRPCKDLVKSSANILKKFFKNF